MNKLASVQLGDGEEGVVEERKEGSRSLVQAGAILENHIYIYIWGIPKTGKGQGWSNEGFSALRSRLGHPCF